MNKRKKVKTMGAPERMSRTTLQLRDIRHQAEGSQTATQIDEGIPVSVLTGSKAEAQAEVVETESARHLPDSQMREVPSPLLTEPLPVEAKVPLSVWRMSGAAVQGLAHWRNGLPCQDAVAWRNSTRPILVLSDGAGSAPASERGATLLVHGLSRFLQTMEDILSPWLDSQAEQAQEDAAKWAQRILRHASGLLEDLAKSERRPVRDLRATLSLVILGKVNSFWWQVGDGVIVAQTAEGMRALGDVGKSKGEFANETRFVDTTDPEDVQYGLLPSTEILGLALMSDGGAEKFVTHDGSKVAVRLGKWLEAAAQETLTADQLAVAFHDPEMWQRTNLDDRSIVLVARKPG